jgi:hypothetical protein
MVDREGEISRGNMPTKFLRRYALTQVERPSTYVKAIGASQEDGGSPGDLDIACA